MIDFDLYESTKSLCFSCGDSRSYIAERRLPLMLLCYVEDRIGILPGYAGLYTVSAITSSTIVPKTTIMSRNYS
jgi:hypothetical protein